MEMLKYFLATVSFSVTCTIAAGQESIPGEPSICYFKPQSAKYAGHIAALASPGIVTKTLSINELSYTGVPANAMPAIQKASDTWASVLISTVPIHIQVTWKSLPGSQVASTRATRLFKNFDGAMQTEVWYPVALAEKITGTELNAGLPDIEIVLNQEVNWYFGTDGNTPADRLDLVTVVLHEMAHGLGFSSFAHVSGNTGILRSNGLLSVYDILLERSQRKRLFAITDNSAEMYAQLTSNDVFIFSPAATKPGAGLLPKVYAPVYYSQGSSISHLDEQSYPPGDPNSLMTPSFSPGESIHSPGNMVLGILSDLGWSKDSHLKPDILVYPNPSNGAFNIRLPLNIASASISLVDITGRAVHLRIIGNENHVDLSYLPAGIYTLLIAAPTGNVAFKAIFVK